MRVVDEMLVHCHVFDDVTYRDEAAPLEGSRKTLARIAFEEVQDEYTVSYGNNTRKLWRSSGSGVAFVQECRAILASLGHVVKDLTDRVGVEFGREDLQAAICSLRPRHLEPRDG